MNIMQTRIRLSPYDPTKYLRLVIDGAKTVGTGFILIQYLNEAKRDFYCSMIRMGAQFYADDKLFTVLCNLCSEKIEESLIKCPNGCLTEYAVLLFKAEKMKREEQNVFCTDYDS